MRSASSSYRDPNGRGLTDTGWEVHPHGFDVVLRKAALVGQTGARDRERHRHAATTGAAATSCGSTSRSSRTAAPPGTPITGYFHWSLLDNFEWLEGFRPRFGLFEVDYSTFARRRRPSADVFAAMGRWFTGEGAAGEPFAASRT